MAYKFVNTQWAPRYNEEDITKFKNINFYTTHNGVYQFATVNNGQFNINIKRKPTLEEEADKTSLEDWL
jgi:hypothetical protein